MDRTEFQAKIRERLRVHCAAESLEYFDTSKETGEVLNMAAEVATLLHDDFDAAWAHLDKNVIDPDTAAQYLLGVNHIHENIEKRRQFLSSIFIQLEQVGVEKDKMRSMAVQMMVQVEQIFGTIENAQPVLLNMETGEEIPLEAAPPKSRMN